MRGKTLFHETGPWCQQGWGPLSWGTYRCSVPAGCPFRNGNGWMGGREGGIGSSSTGHPAGEQGHAPPSTMGSQHGWCRPLSLPPVSDVRVPQRISPAVVSPRWAWLPTGRVVLLSQLVLWGSLSGELSWPLSKCGSQAPHTGWLRARSGCGTPTHTCWWALECSGCPLPPASHRSPSEHLFRKP